MYFDVAGNFIPNVVVCSDRRYLSGSTGRHGSDCFYLH